jgi:dephospho-CoA kinase
MPMTIGLTGSIGAGKSSVAALFKEFGAEVVSGDELGKQSLARQPELIASIRERFGDAVFDGASELNRRKLGEIVFSDNAHVRWLTEQTFPYIHQEWRTAVDRTKCSLIVLDASLIFEWGIETEFDKIIVVTASKQAVAARAAAGRFTAVELEQRANSQLPIEIKIVGADIVIHNYGTPVDLRSHVEALWKSWTFPEQNKTQGLI